MWANGRPEYADICHPQKGQPHRDIVLWVHTAGRVESRSAKGGKGHEDFWSDGNHHLADGRVDAAKMVGSLVLSPGAGREQAAKVAEDIVAAFPGVRFWVFHESDWGVPMQEFWESVC